MEYAATGLGRAEQSPAGRPSFLEVIAQESTRSLLPSLLTTLLEVHHGGLAL